MNPNFSVRFQIVRDNQNTTMPGIFGSNTTIEMSRPPISLFNTRNMSSPFFVLESSQTNVQPPPFSHDLPSFMMGSLFDMFSTSLEQQPNPPNILEMFLNQSLQTDQTQTEKATPEMIKQLGSYRRIKEDDTLIDNDCVICMSNYQKDEGVRELDCKHTFHKKCIDKWLKEGSVCCPVCRKNPFPKQEDSSPNP